MGFVSELGQYKDRVVEELQVATGTPDVRSVDHQSTTIRSQDVDKHKPDQKRLERYWDLYKQVPIIRKPIRGFAREVIAPGYYIDTENEEAREEIEEWLAECAIVSGETGKDFSKLLKKTTIQREVKGTALVEKVYYGENKDKLYGFKPIKPETMRAFTYPGQAVLLDADADVDQGNAIWGDREIYTTDDGEIAAYAQFNDDLGVSDAPTYIAFKKENILKLERDADVGEVFGNSRLESIEDRLESLLKKLEDNDKAIESLAHPFQLFQFGEGDDVWEPEEISHFMSQHDQSDFEPGMKQGVQGDVSVDTVSGEVAPIGEFLQFDVNWIISEMPLPKYALGGFEEDVNQFVSRSQETRIEEQIKEARKEIIDEWTPVIQDKAEEFGYSDDVELVIGTPPEQFDASEYREFLEEKEKEGGSGSEGGSTDYTRPPASTEPERTESEGGEEE